MYQYTILDFAKIGELITDEKYPNAEYIQFLRNFDNVAFDAPVPVKAVLVELAIPSNNRVCNALLYGHTIDELNDYPEGQMPEPVGRLQLTLWRDHGPKIDDSYFY
jgi:hypothetical protein